MLSAWSRGCRNRLQGIKHAVMFVGAGTVTLNPTPVVKLVQDASLP